MQHDNEYLGGMYRGSTALRLPRPTLLRHLKEYAEHQDRWRDLSKGEIPEEGQPIRVMYRNEVNGEIVVERWDWHPEMMPWGYQWKPDDTPEYLHNEGAG